MKSVLKCSIVVTSVLACAAQTQAQYSFSYLGTPPGGVSGSSPMAYGISDGNVVGQYYNAGNTANDGFIYNVSTASYNNTPLSNPNQASDNFNAYGISGNTVVGNYKVSGSDYGFIYSIASGSVTTTLYGPAGASFLVAQAVSGNNIVGYYGVANTGTNHVFLFDGSNYTTPAAPAGASYMTFNGIDGNNIVGSYSLGGNTDGFLYDGTGYTTLNDPNAVNGTVANGILGDDIVGYYLDANGNANGFIYDKSTGVYTTVNDGTDTVIKGIDNNGYIVGYDSTGSFIGAPSLTPTPEPSTWALFGLGGLAIGALYRRKLNVA